MLNRRVIFTAECTAFRSNVHTRDGDGVPSDVAVWSAVAVDATFVATGGSRALKVAGSRRASRAAS